LFLKRNTRHGHSRDFAQDRENHRHSSGVDQDASYVTSAIGGALAGLGAVLLACNTP